MIPLLAQTIETGITWLDPFLNAFFVNYGALPTMLLLGLAMLFYVLWRKQQSKIDRENIKNEQTELFNDMNRKNFDEVSKVREELRLSEKSHHVLEGRVQELSKMYAAAQARYEEKERAWEKEQRNLEERINKLSVQYTELLKDHNGNKAALAEVGLERDLLKVQLADIERDKLELQTKIEHQKAEIERLQAELATADTSSKLDETIAFPDMALTELNKEFSKDSPDAPKP